MCFSCGALAYCDKIECGALPKYDENGKHRYKYLFWFYPEDRYLCKHVLEGHHEECALRHFHDCSCEWAEDDEDYLKCWCEDDT